MIVGLEKLFKDRKDAGLTLGKILERRYKDRNALVLGIPRGGVIIAAEIAKCIRGQLSTIVTKKLPHPTHQESAIGAAAEDGSTYLLSVVKGMSPDVVKKILSEQQKEIQSRIERFRNGQPLPDMNNRVVIIADDGIATGSTIVPAIKLCKNRNAAKIVVTAPVSGEYFVSEINDLADEVVIAERPEFFYAVGQAYEDFHHLSDEEVIRTICDFRRAIIPPSSFLWGSQSKR